MRPTDASQTRVKIRPKSIIPRSPVIVYNFKPIDGKIQLTYYTLEKRNNTLTFTVHQLFVSVGQLGVNNVTLYINHSAQLYRWINTK